MWFVTWRGMTFSTWWLGPELLEQLERVAFRPKVRAQARTSRSEDAWVEVYGERGGSGVSSVKRAGSASARSP